MGIEDINDDEQLLGGSKKGKDQSTKNSDNKTPMLDSFGKNLTKMAEDGKLDPIIGREEEIDRIIQILGRRKKNNPVLVGEPGCVLPDTMIKIRKISNEDSHRFIES